MRVRVIRYSKSFASGECSRYRQVSLGSPASALTAANDSNMLLESHSSSREGCCAIVSLTEVRRFLDRSTVLSTSERGRFSILSMAFQDRYSSSRAMRWAIPSPISVSRLCCTSSWRSCVSAPSPVNAVILFLPSQSDCSAAFVSSPSMSWQIINLCYSMMN